MSEVATPYGYTLKKDETVKSVPWPDITIVAPGGSNCSTVEDMGKWLQVQFWVSGQNIVRKETLDEIHSIQMAIQDILKAGTGILGYALGWVIAFNRGRYMIWHSGGVDGFGSYVAFIPEEKIGINSFHCWFLICSC